MDLENLAAQLQQTLTGLTQACAAVQTQASQGQSLAGQVINAGGARFRVGLSRFYMVVPISVTAGSSETAGTKIFNAPRDLLVEHITAYCSDSRGLDAFRLGWYIDNGLNTDFFAPTSDDALPTYPLASTFLTDAGIWRMDRPNLVFVKDSKRTFKAIDATGTAPYTVELTLHIRLLERVA